MSKLCKLMNDERKPCQKLCKLIKEHEERKDVLLTINDILSSIEPVELDRKKQIGSLADFPGEIPLNLETIERKYEVYHPGCKTKLQCNPPNINDKMNCKDLGDLAEDLVCKVFYQVGKYLESLGIPSFLVKSYKHKEHTKKH